MKIIKHSPISTVTIISLVIVIALGGYGLCFKTNAAWGEIDMKDSSSFITTWKLSKDNDSIFIPTIGDGYGYKISWGDESEPDIATGSIRHVYKEAGVYKVTIQGDFPRIFFNASSPVYEDSKFNIKHKAGNAEKIVSIDQWGDIEWTSMTNAFSGCVNLSGEAVDSPDLSAVERASSMFSGATSFNQDIGDWDVGNVVYMDAMFSGATSFNQDIGDWDVGNVMYMDAMFSGATSFNQDIGSWDVENVESMTSMFEEATSFNQNIGSWDVGNVWNMSFMFSEATLFNQNIGSWDVENVRVMACMFEEATSFNQDIGDWDVGNVTYMLGMFEEATSFNQDIGDWDVGNVSNTDYMFHEATLFNQNIGSWDVENVESMTSMFHEATSFNQNIGSWDVGNVESMTSMFEGATSFNQNIGSWDVGNVNDMRSMFYKVELSTDNYDALLYGWSKRSVQQKVHFDGGRSKYSANAADSRDALTVGKNWTIQDYGLAREG